MPCNEVCHVAVEDVESQNYVAFHRNQTVTLAIRQIKSKIFFQYF
jgi:hypothetical protein